MIGLTDLRQGDKDQQTDQPTHAKLCAHLCVAESRRLPLDISSRICPVINLFTLCCNENIKK